MSSITYRYIPGKKIVREIEFIDFKHQYSRKFSGCRGLFILTTSEQIVLRNKYGKQLELMMSDIGFFKNIYLQLVGMIMRVSSRVRLIYIKVNDDLPAVMFVRLSEHNLLNVVFIRGEVVVDNE